MTANYQIAVIHNSGKILEVIKAHHIDSVVSHTVFYRETNSDDIRIYNELKSIQIRDKKVILIYENYRCEIIKI